MGYNNQHLRASCNSHRFLIWDRLQGQLKPLARIGLVG